MERPILFSDAMVRAILDGSKTQTRRPILPTSRSADGIAVYTQGSEVVEVVNAFEGEPIDAPSIRPPYAVGDRMWVRECWGAWRRVNVEYDEWEPITKPLGGSWNTEREHNGEPTIEYRATSKSLGPWKPSIHMPRWASRIALHVIDVQAERLQSISERDACAEGFGSPITRDCKRPRFAAAWDAVYGPGAWKRNPWVWAIKFVRVKPRTSRGEHR